MKLFHKTSALSFYMIHSGFLAFKTRVKEELDAAGGGNLDDLWTTTACMPTTATETRRIMSPPRSGTRLSKKTSPTQAFHSLPPR